MLRFTRTAACVFLAALATAASALNYPSRPVKLIVPVPAGGITDAIARVIAQRLQEMWHQTVVVENRPGHSGIGAQVVERAPADGLTLLVAPDAIFTATPALLSKLIYDPDSFTPIAGLARGMPMLVVHPSLPVKTVPELIAYAKANPGKLNYGSFGIGTYSHLSMEDLKQRAGIDLQHVPYRGAASALTGFLGNDVSVMIINLSSIEGHAKAGKVRLVAAATENRVPALPDLPTVSETVAGFHTSVWFGLWGPARMPPDLVAKVHADSSKALDHPETKNLFKTNSFERFDLSPQDFDKFIQTDRKHLGALIKAIGIKID
ncbi:MAG TPA: tripartite tricarboxylate transporter substrate binding protein, partial [Burkholderiaceae bacterium]|nr:tripartite tricarboxylate transporter substrate binding protein [Burkholderiaceae bacterium]